MSEGKVINLCRSFDRITDSEFERNYDYVVWGCGVAEIIQLDLRYSAWHDLWALIQFLMILGHNPARTKPRRILLLSPEALPPETTERERGHALARLRFLSDMQFFDRAAELEVTLQLQVGRGGETRIVNPSDIRQIASPASHEDGGGGRPIIPITSLSSISSELREKRDELFHKAEEIFAKFYTEAIVQEAGLGDCLLSELLTNAIEHGNPERGHRIGYIALRAGLGLHGARRRDAEEYKARKFARIHHELGDWAAYFERHPDDPYFELVIVDRGEGISNSIQKDERLPEDLKVTKLLPRVRQHKLIKYALGATSSRYSAKTRQQKDRTEFTGLGAVSHVLAAHGGFLLIREGTCRHIFGALKDPLGICCATVANRTKTTERFGPRTKTIEIPLKPIRGTSITAVIPMKGTHHTPLGYSAPSPGAWQTDAYVKDDPEVAVFRVRAPQAVSERSFLDIERGATWETLAKRIQSEDYAVAAILVDIGAASLMRNELWLGLTKVRKVCQARRIPLFLCGLDERAASRLEENAYLDRKQIADGKDWILLAFGDDGKVYPIGFFGSDLKQKEAIAETAAQMFAVGKVRSSLASSLLEEGNYVSLLPTTAYRKPSECWVASLSSLRNALQRSQGQCLKAGIIKTPAWKPDITVRLSGGTVVREYLCVHSVSQLREMTKDFLRLLRIVASPIDFDFVVGVGPIAHMTARSLGQHLFRDNRSGSRRLKLNNYAYHDYYSFDHGEASSRVIPEDSKVLVIVDGIRSGSHAAEVIHHILSSTVVSGHSFGRIPSHGQLEE